ncbi:branched-chain amino acid transport system II carrier protein [Aggregatimonas sangjinii]|uniref:Branched-chain amino acid transport system II carrier protein n=1 Tax=Aggregatimonas sangjinii TaxID=2583587 RepID=A0A5B7SYB9_9FLAO|nr:branched-chain amino acid transport system II carrier protein [Aggregatimonas sangjinii]QCX01770.1 branched-chain amino acid transport system II carrier protein [Aggregatimonas sangjinii]
MHSNKEIFVTAFALFSLFFGAGNLILPPLLGFQAGGLWWLVALGFCLSAVLIPIFGILAHAKLQGTIFDFGKKVSPTFSLVYSILIYAISVSLPSPRTAAVTHEIAIDPFFGSSPWYTSIVYFALVFLFVINRSKILSIIGKLLTPAIIIILLLIIGVALFSHDFAFGITIFDSPFTDGILEGYQTFDAIGAVVVGGVIIVSINIKKKDAPYEEKKTLIRRAGWLAGLGLFLIYAGLIITGALMHGEFDAGISRTALLSGISTKTLGGTANLFLSILVSLACFTTAVGIVTGTADFVKHRFRDSQQAYLITALIGCVLGVVMGQFNVDYIIAVALPALMFLYPITIVLILLNVVPERFAAPKVFKAVVIATCIFSIPDFMGSVGFPLFPKGGTFSWIPLQDYSMGWVLPALVVFVVSNLNTTPQKKV